MIKPQCQFRQMNLRYKKISEKTCKCEAWFKGKQGFLTITYVQNMQ